MISVLLATYNGEKYIQQAVESVLNQTCPDFEILVGFNGTTDNSMEIVSGFRDKRIRMFDFKDDKGKAKTLNKLLAKARFEWVAIQDDDDIWEVEKLEKQIPFFDSYDIIGSNISYIDEDGVFKQELKLSENHEDIITKSMSGNNQIANTSAIFRKKKALEVSGWDERIDGIEDFDFWLKMIRVGGCKAYNIQENLVKHRLHNKSNFNTKKHDVASVIIRY